MATNEKAWPANGDVTWGHAFFFLLEPSMSSPFVPRAKPQCGVCSLDCVWLKNRKPDCEDETRKRLDVSSASEYGPLVNRCRWGTPAPWTAGRSCSSWCRTPRTGRCWTPTTAPRWSAAAPHGGRSLSEDGQKNTKHAFTFKHCTETA